MVSELKLVDIWRIKNPTWKAYTFFSAPQKSHSRIDMIWATTDLLIETKDVNMQPRTLADHNPMEWEINKRGGKRSWKLNIDYWNDPNFKSLLVKEMKEFFTLNSKGEVAPEIVWDTGKAYLRGMVIKYAAAKNKERNKMYTEILHKLPKLEKKLHKYPEDDKLKNEIGELQHQYNLLRTQEIARQIRLNKQNYFENANKAGKWLAHRLRKKEKNRIKSLKLKKVL